MNSNLKKLLKAVEIELNKTEKNYHHTRNSAREIAASASASPSQSGDRYHSQATADLAKQRYEEAQKLMDEIKVKGEEIVINHNGEEVYLVDNPILVSGFKIVSTRSPLGQTLKLHTK